ncbi:uncharacterized protein HMPREF1541_05292, partial [Cyphellophora europaea CBS 101466]
LAEIEEVVRQYFATSFFQLPILSKRRFLDDLPYVYFRPRADYLLLCVSISLILQKPKTTNFVGESMQSSLYVITKCLIASLEAANYVSLNVLQSRMLVCLYELGHAIYPAASMSISACAKSARALGI